jgi:hypothetical protein
MEMDASFQKEILILKGIGNNIFANVGRIVVDILDIVGVGEAAEICHGFGNCLIFFEQQGIEVDRYHQDVGHSISPWKRCVPDSGD